MLSLLLLGQRLRRLEGPAGSCKMTRGVAGSPHPRWESRQMGREAGVCVLHRHKPSRCVCVVEECQEGLGHPSRSGEGSIPFAKQPRPVSR